MNKIYSEKSILIITLCDDDVSIIADGTIIIVSLPFCVLTNWDLKK